MMRCLRHLFLLQMFLADLRKSKISGMIRYESFQLGCRENILGKCGKISVEDSVLYEKLKPEQQCSALAVKAPNM